MNWADWVFGLCYGLGLGATVVGAIQQGTINSLKKTVVIQLSTIGSQGKTIDMQQAIIKRLEDGA